MMTFFDSLLNSSMYSPHGICLLWEPTLIWLHVVSDAVTAIAYFSIPFVLGLFVYRRRDLKFSWVYMAFAAFILACGLTHILAIYTLWVPVYGIEGLAKAATAIASAVTAAMLWPLLPKVVALPSPFQLQQAYEALREEEERSETLLQQFRNVQATEAQIRQAQKMEAIGQLTGGVAHDFNNILTVITGTIDIIAEGLTNRPELQALTSLIDNAARRGATLTSQLLAFSRKQPLQPRAVNVHSLLKECVSLLRPTLEENILIDVALDDDAAIALIDPAQLSTAILNLAVNARDAMRAGGRLSFEARKIEISETAPGPDPDIAPGRYVLISVNDTGEGIAPENLHKVFDPFFTTKEVGKGSGLGLSMVYGFLEQSGGHIRISSKIAQGTSVRLYLPQIADPADERNMEDPGGQLDRGSETILVVEDDPAVRKSVSIQLSSLGYQVVTAENSSEALGILRSGQKVHLMFTDVIMPGEMNGRQLAEAVKASQPHIGIVYTSGYTRNALISNGRIDPDVVLLAKPFRREELAATIKKALDQATECTMAHPAA